MVDGISKQWSRGRRGIESTDGFRYGERTTASGRLLPFGNNRGNSMNNDSFAGAVIGLVFYCSPLGIRALSSAVVAGPWITSPSFVNTEP